MEENLKYLPTQCDISAKRNSKGHYETWKGFKLHIDVADGDIPISAILTSVSLHDSQAVIPLIQMSSDRVTYLWNLSPRKTTEVLQVAQPHLERIFKSRKVL
jgi:hypothetical protein